MSKEEAQAIMAFEQARSQRLFRVIAVLIAATLIGLGVILVVAANWQTIPDIIKLGADWLLLAMASFFAYDAIVKNKPAQREGALVFATLMVGASIGLTGQVFHLDGGWMAFLYAWAALSVVFVCFSQTVFLPFGWIILLALGTMDPIEDLLNCLEDDFLLCLLFFAFIVCAYFALDYWRKKTVLLAHHFCHALCLFLLCCAYFTAWFTGFQWGEYPLWHTQIIAHFCVLSFFALRLLYSAAQQNINAFRIDAFHLEIYIFVIFCLRFSDLALSGLGFIGGGVLILLMLWAIQYTQQYINRLRLFNKEKP